MHSNPFKILLVEDDPTDAMLVRRILGRSTTRQFNIEHCDSLRAAQRFEGLNQVDAILLDLHLPDSAGLGTLKRLQEDASQVPIVVLTGLDDDAIAMEALQSGAQDFLTKESFQSDLLERTIHYAIRRHATLRKLQVEVQLRRTAEAKLARIAHYDDLTGLANRAHFRRSLDELISTCHRSKQQFALMFLDLDRFKDVNDSLGHMLGDQLLQQVAHRLRSCLRGGDIAARMGGDEFTVVLYGVDIPERAAEVAKRIIDELHAPHSLSGEEVVVTTSIGISMFPRDAETRADLLKGADVAMYRAKELGRNNYQFITSALNKRVQERFMLERGLRQAMAKNEFELYYQPQIELQSGQVIGTEALIRWCQPDGQIVSPKDFIPILEETGLINEVGSWVIDTAVRENRRWQDLGNPPRRVAVNLSARQWQRDDVVEQIAQSLQRAGLHAPQLELELTEGEIIKDPETVKERVHALKKIGIKIAIDDFGTGYSNLGMLKKMPLDMLKIDRVFVRDIVHDPNDAAIAQAIIALGHNLGLKVLAEGVETAAQLEFLKQHGCDIVQGFLFAKPMPAPKYLRWLENFDHSSLCARRSA